MDALLELIKSQTQKEINQSVAIFSIPCRVVAQVGDEKYTVKVIGSDVQYDVYNLSGSSVNVGEQVQLYYRNGIISSRTSYIGASLTKGGGGGSPCEYVTGFSNNAALSNTYKEINAIYFRALGTTKIFLSCNVTVEGTSTGNAVFRIYYDNELINYEPKSSVSIGGYSNVNISLPFSCVLGDHKIKIMAIGAGRVTSYGFVFGQLITATSGYTATDEDDYIYETTADSANTIFYTGETVQPAVPATLSEKDTDIIRATTFGGTGVVRVLIPDGITEIE